jgi:hypothetical protein
MKQSAPQTGASLGASPTSTWTIVDSPLGLLGRLPLELRDKIYEYITDDLLELVIPPHFDDSLLAFLTRRLPRCLFLCHQIFDEAAKAYLHHTMLTLTSASVPSPKILLSQAVTSMAFKNLRSLDFTKPQHCYAHSSDSMSQLAAEECVHDVVQRCPILRDLTMTISADILFKPSQILPPSPLPNLRTMQEVEEKMQFARLFEQRFPRKFEPDHLLSLQLICNDADRYSRRIGKDNRSLFEPFAKTFMAEAKKKKNKMAFNIKICPGAPGTYDPKWPELTWTKGDNITSYYYMDFFG